MKRETNTFEKGKENCGPEKEKRTNKDLNAITWGGCLLFVGGGGWGGVWGVCGGGGGFGGGFCLGGGGGGGKNGKGGASPIVGTGAER